MRSTGRNTALLWPCLGERVGGLEARVVVAMAAAGGSAAAAATAAAEKAMVGAAGAARVAWVARTVEMGAEAAETEQAAGALHGQRAKQGLQAQAGRAAGTRKHRKLQTVQAGRARHPQSWTVMLYSEA